MMAVACTKSTTHIVLLRRMLENKGAETCELGKSTNVGTFKLDVNVGVGSVHLSYSGSHFDIKGEVLNKMEERRPPKGVGVSGGGAGKVGNPAELKSAS